MAPRNRLRSEETKLVQFVAEESLAEWLSGLPNKSSFIRKAIVTQLGMACPTCYGSGIVPRGLAMVYADALENVHPHCAKCDTELPLPRKLVDYAAADQPRIEQFLMGGELFCAACYPDIPQCEECPWRVTPEMMGEHIKMVHRG